MQPTASQQRWADVVQMLYTCTNVLCLLGYAQSHSVSTASFIQYNQV